MDDSHRARARSGRAFRYFVLAPLAALAIGSAPVQVKLASLPPGVDVALPADVVFDRMVGPDSAVVFSHMTHARIEGYRCSTCHPKLFRILAPTRHISHLVMDQGASCGTCHDGKHAFDVRAKQSCGSCHNGRTRPGGVRASTASAGGAPVFRGPPPLAIHSGAASPGQVTFRHSTHVTQHVSCSSCHPSPFEMHPSANESEAALHGHASCGSCHDGQAAFGVHDDRACGRCHVEGRVAR